MYVVPDKAGEVYDGDGQVDLHVLVQGLAEVLLQPGEDGVVHRQLPLVHRHRLEALGDLDEPVLVGHVVTDLVEHVQDVGATQAT